jgi:methionyl-tRNA formyltransferase
VRIVFLGTSAFACPALRALARAYDVALVITQPDRPAGRKRELRPSAVKTASLDLGLRIAQPERINSEEGINLLRETAPEAIVVASYGQFLSTKVFSLPPHGTINIHASFLPRYRGAAPINWAIIRGETETGVTTFFIEKGMDSGEILVQRSCPIGSNETAGELHDHLATLGAEAILDTLHSIEEGTAHPTPQREEEATLAPKLSRVDGEMDWMKRTCDIHNLVRGLNPWPGAFTHLGGETVKIHRTTLTGIGRGNVEPGMIVLQETGRLLIGTGDELIEILEIQREGHPRTSGKAFLNGLRGDSLFS